MPSIVVSNLGKAYKKYNSPWDRLAEWTDPRNKVRHDLEWILKDINFQVMPGEAVGIIGINGAGKSTLLKIIAGTVAPTMGTTNISGRLAALLELGMGFHPDFSGKQNVLLSGQLLGYSAEELIDIMPQIVSFADIGDYIDRPIRFYSSGMQMRLAFSIATAFRPDILIVDEALSVGDAAFQHKCFERIRKFREQGTTLLIVSHDKQAIQSICDRALLINAGRLELEGSTESVMDYYNALIADPLPGQIVQRNSADGKVQTVSGSKEASVKNISLLDLNGNMLEVINTVAQVLLRIDVEVEEFLNALVVGFAIKDRFGQVVFGTNTHFTGQVIKNVKPGQQVRCDIKFSANLGPGSYSIQTALVNSYNHLDKNYEWRDLAMVFEVVNNSHALFAGTVYLPCEFCIT